MQLLTPLGGLVDTFLPVVSGVPQLQNKPSIQTPADDGTSVVTVLIGKNIWTVKKIGRGTSDPPDSGSGLRCVEFVLVRIHRNGRTGPLIAISEPSEIQSWNTEAHEKFTQLFRNPGPPFLFAVWHNTADMLNLRLEKA